MIVRCRPLDFEVQSPRLQRLWSRITHLYLRLSSGKLCNHSPGDPALSWTCHPITYPSAKALDSLAVESTPSAETLFILSPFLSDDSPFLRQLLLSVRSATPLLTIATTSGSRSNGPRPFHSIYRSLSPRLPRDLPFGQRRYRVHLLELPRSARVSW
jgi:hypothetical protein